MGWLDPFSARDQQVAELEWRLQIQERRNAILSNRMKWMEIQMAKNQDALAALDSELDALEAYIKSDDETDAAEVNARAERIRNLLVSAQGSGEVEPEKAAEVEEKLTELGSEVQGQGSDASASE
jgi:hypothetical protein